MTSTRTCSGREFFARFGHLMWMRCWPRAWSFCRAGSCSRHFNRIGMGYWGAAQMWHCYGILAGVSMAINVQISEAHNGTAMGLADITRTRTVNMNPTQHSLRISHLIVRQAG